VIFCIRAFLLSVLVVDVFGQTNGNFSLTMEPAAVSVTAATSAMATMRVAVAAGFNQPVYLIPGAMPEGVSVLIPSPVVGSHGGD